MKHPQRQEIFDVLDELPDAIWQAYLYAIRGVNLVMGNFVLDDPTPCEAIEQGIRRALGEKADNV